MFSLRHLRFMSSFDLDVQRAYIVLYYIIAQTSFIFSNDEII